MERPSYSVSKDIRWSHLLNNGLRVFIGKWLCLSAAQWAKCRPVTKLRIFIYQSRFLVCDHALLSRCITHNAEEFHLRNICMYMGRDIESGKKFLWNLERLLIYSKREGGEGESNSGFCCEIGTEIAFWKKLKLNLWMHFSSFKTFSKISFHLCKQF